MPDTKLYDLLGVSKTAPADEIRSAYRKLARKYHPDVNPGDEKAETRFKEISAAYDVLGDPAKRKAYDEFGEESLRGGFDPEKARAYQRWQHTRSATGGPSPGGGVHFDVGDLGDLGDLFGGDLFGGRGGRRRRARGPRKGPDVTGVVELDFVQAIRGTEVSLQVMDNGGARTVTVRIPPGADDGSVLRIAGKGGAGPGGGPAGDLVIETRVRPHRRVRREGLDLHLTLPITLDEAYSGATVEVPTFDGPVRLTIPPRSQPGQKLRLRGKGVPRKDRRGDLYVELDVRLPDRPDPELADAFRKATGAYSEPVRKDLTL